MTPAQLEHLKLIDAHLERLLAIAEKRTPGVWVQKANLQGRMGDIYSDDRPDTLATTLFLGWTENEMKQNAAFIAACAGNAEAGWRATRAAITCILDMEPTSITFACLGQPLMESILAAFPLELIQKP